MIVLGKRRRYDTSIDSYKKNKENFSIHLDKKAPSCVFSSIHLQKRPVESLEFAPSAQTWPCPALPSFTPIFLVYKCFYGLGLSYLSDIILQYDPSQTLRSSGTDVFLELQSKLTVRLH